MPSETYVGLPKGKLLAQVVDEHIDRERERATWRWTMWNLAWYYLNGARRFDVYDPNTGLLRPHYLDEEGRMEYQAQDLLSHIDRVTGMLASMDVRAAVHRKGNSLPAIRDRAIGQIMLDAAGSEEQIDRVNTQFAYTLCSLGMCGISGHVEDHPVVGLTADYEVVHPRELFSFPNLGQDYTKQRGLIRQRTVPLNWLKEKYGGRITRNMGMMEIWQQRTGERLDEGVEEDPDVPGGGVEYNVNKGMGSATAEKEALTELVRIRELWVWGHRGILEKYAIMSGQYVIEEVDYKQEAEVYCPIGVARFIETGSFYGAGLFDILFSTHRQMEFLLKTLVNNVRDIDRYGVVVMPQGQFNKRALLTEVGEGLRVLPWDPDPVDPGFRPFNIQPFNSGDVPGKTAMLMRDVLQNLSPWQNLLQEKGRVDSAAGLSFLDEKNKQLMTNATRNVEQAWSQAHRNVLQRMNAAVVGSQRALPVETLTLDLAGAVINAETGEVSFEQNPVPTLGNLGITIKDANPRSELARKQEALQLFQMEGLNDPQRFILHSLKEGLDFSMYVENERAAYQTIIRNCLLLYNDGVTPDQEVVITPYTSAPDLQLEVLQGFMSGPQMQMASPAVQEAFKMYREHLMDYMGMVLPAAIPNPDDLAMLRMMGEQGPNPQGPAGPPGAGGPPQGGPPQPQG
jgi:hypothetical protein